MSQATGWGLRVLGGLRSRQVNAMGRVLSYKASRAELINRAVRRVMITSALRHRNTRAPEAVINFCSQNDLIGVEVLCSGGFENELLPLFKTIVGQHVASNHLECKKGFALDIGANIGTHTLFFSTFVDKVFAFEPNPSVALVCRANQLSAGRSNIEVFDVALSDHDGTASLFAPPFGNFGWSSLEIGDGSETEVPVAVRRADEFVLPRLKRDEHIVLVKVDVEGHEEKVFKGMLDLLRTHRPVLLFESLSRDHLMHCRNILQSVGYHRFDAIVKEWEAHQSHATRLASILLGRTRISLKPIDFNEDRFHACVVGRPSDSSNGQTITLQS